MNIGYSLTQLSSVQGFNLRLLGSFVVMAPGFKLLEFSSKKLQLIVAILAFRDGEPMERRELARILWSRHAEDNALTSLRQALAKLRQHLGSDFEKLIISDRRFIKINRETVNSDIRELRSMNRLTEECKARWMELTAGGAFENLHLDEPSVREWVTSARCEIFYRMVQLLDEWIEDKEVRDSDRHGGEWALQEKDRIKRLYRYENASLTEMQIQDGITTTSFPYHQYTVSEDKIATVLNLQQYKNYLRYKVNDFWISGVFNRHQEARQLMDLELTLEPNLVCTPYELSLLSWITDTAKMDKQHLKSSQLREFYHECRGNLLVVGDTGAGKTTLLLRLVNELLLESLSTLHARVPVILNASGWLRHKGSFMEWLIDELDYRYDVPAQIGRQLIRGNHIALFVDGLDGVGHYSMHGLINSINEFCKDYPTLPLAIFCHSQWYLGLGQKLSSVAALVLSPVDRNTLAAFVQSCEPSSAKYTYGQSGSSDWITSPLGVHMAMSLTDGHIESENHQLIEKYVDSLLSKDSGDNLTRTQLVHYLPGFARMMVNAGRSIFYMDDFVDTTLYNKHIAFWIKLIPITLIAVLCALIVGFVAYQQTPGAAAFYIPMLHTLVCVSFLIALGGGSSARLLPRYHYTLTSLRKNLVLHGKIMAFCSFTAFACCWVIFGLKYGVVIGSGVLFIFLIYCCLDHRSAGSPKENFGAFYEFTRRALVNAAYGLPLGFAIGLMADYFLYGYVHLGLASLLFPCIYFFVLGGHAVLQSYVARWILHWCGRVPLDFKGFVKAACARKILCRVGGGVMFSHRSIMEHLAGKYRNS